MGLLWCAAISVNMILAAHHSHWRQTCLQVLFWGLRKQTRFHCTYLFVMKVTTPLYLMTHWHFLRCTWMLSQQRFVCPIDDICCLALSTDCSFHACCKIHVTMWHRHSFSMTKNDVHHSCHLWLIHKIQVRMCLMCSTIW